MTVKDLEKSLEKKAESITTSKTLPSVKKRGKIKVGKLEKLASKEIKKIETKRNEIRLSPAQAF